MLSEERGKQDPGFPGAEMSVVLRNGPARVLRKEGSSSSLCLLCLVLDSVFQDHVCVYDVLRWVHREQDRNIQFRS